jgi:hypothetical protein
LDWGLLLFFAAILGAIAASNIWLRRRAAAASEAESDSDSRTNSIDA